MTYETSPTARALLALELIQNSPGVTAERLADKLGVSDRAARRYVGILREAGIPVESTRGPYGGYRIGRGLRVPPLMFSAAEALGLVMAVLEAHGIADTDDTVGGALSKIIRVLPAPVARSAEAMRQVRGRGQGTGAPQPDPETTAALVQACAARTRLRIGYRLPRAVSMDVDPWAVVLRNSRWYLLCWSHSAGATRVLRLDRVGTIDVLPDTFEPPADLDPLRMLEEQLAQGWKYGVEVLIDAPFDAVVCWVPPIRGRLEPIDADHTRLVGSTNEPDWYAERLAMIRVPFRIIGGPEIIEAARVLGQRLVTASAAP